jgi:hypothetical protein
MGRIAAHDECIFNWIVVHRTEGVHRPGVIPIDTCDWDAFRTYSICTRIIIRIQPTPCQASDIKKQRTVVPVLPMRIAAKDDDSTTPSIERAASMGLPFEDDRATGALLVDL